MCDLFAALVTDGQTGAGTVPIWVHVDRNVPIKGVMSKWAPRRDAAGKKVAAQYGLEYTTCDAYQLNKANAAIADAMVAFLPKPAAGNRRLSLDPAESHLRPELAHLISLFRQNDSAVTFDPACDWTALTESSRPVLVLWDVNETKIDTCGAALCDWAREHAGPAATIMVSGSDECENPLVESAGTAVFFKALALADVFEQSGSSP